MKAVWKFTQNTAQGMERTREVRSCGIHSHALRGGDTIATAHCLPRPLAVFLSELHHSAFQVPSDTQCPLEGLWLQTTEYMSQHGSVDKPGVRGSRVGYLSSSALEPFLSNSSLLVFPTDHKTAATAPSITSSHNRKESYSLSSSFYQGRRPFPDTDPTPHPL